MPYDRLTADEVVQQLIVLTGDDPERKGLIETPRRVIQSYKELYSGYTTKVSDLFTVFEEKQDEMVIIKNVDFFSTCEHHLLPFFGKAHMAYLPKDKVIGASKLPRVFEAFSRRLQIQERIGQQFIDAVNKHLDPYGVAVVIEARHLCMAARGVECPNGIFITNHLSGRFQSDYMVRNEFLMSLNRKDPL